MSNYFRRNVTVKVYDWDGNPTEIEIESFGFTNDEAQMISNTYFKHCEHVCHEGRLDFARQLLNLVEEGKIAVTPTKG